MTAHSFHPTLLREYDIRGVLGSTLSAEDARAVGRSFGTVVVRKGGQKVCLGFDGRLSSPELQQAVADGLASTGLTVLRVGMGPTPMLYFATRHLHADAGLMVTGSHNPPDYNGFKMVLGKGPVYGKAILEIGEISEAGDHATGEGRIEDVDITDAYLQRLAQDWHGGDDLTVVWDCGNGATGEVMQRLVKMLPGTHHLLFAEVDGNFPNHHPDPTIPENLIDLQAKVKEVGADLGIGFDGDGDRIGAITGSGKIVWGDQLIALYSRDVLKRHPGGTIIADVKSSQVLFDEIARLGGKPLMWNTGHSLIKAKMAEIDAPLAGEMSGHIFFQDGWYGFDDAIYCGVRLCNLIVDLGEDLETMRASLPETFNTPETRFQVDESRKFQVPAEVKQRLAAEGAQVNDIDGVRVLTEEGWWLCRASNTQDVLVVRAEAQSPEGLEHLKQVIRGQLAASGIAAPADF